MLTELSPLKENPFPLPNFRFSLQCCFHFSFSCDRWAHSCILENRAHLKLVLEAYAALQTIMLSCEESQ